LDKNNIKRITIEELAKDEWINEGFDTPLYESM
jgi:hypothetical protein